MNFCISVKSNSYRPYLDHIPLPSAVQWRYSKKLEIFQSDCLPKKIFKIHQSTRLFTKCKELFQFVTLQRNSSTTAIVRTAFGHGAGMMAENSQAKFVRICIVIKIICQWRLSFVNVYGLSAVPSEILHIFRSLFTQLGICTDVLTIVLLATGSETKRNGKES